MKYVVPPTTKVRWRLDFTRLCAGLLYLCCDLGVTERGNRKEVSQQTAELPKSFSSEFLLPIMCWFVTVKDMSGLSRTSPSVGGLMYNFSSFFFFFQRKFVIALFESECSSNFYNGTIMKLLSCGKSHRFHLECLFCEGKSNKGEAKWTEGSQAVVSSKAREHLATGRTV